MTTGCLLQRDYQTPKRLTPAHEGPTRTCALSRSAPSAYGSTIRVPVAHACEISLSTDVQHEVGNVQKCLAAGHEELVVIASDQRFVAKMEKALAVDLTAESRTRVRVFQPEDLVTYLDELNQPRPVEQTVPGYRVKVSYLGTRDEDMRREAISRVLLRGRNRAKGTREST